MISSIAALKRRPKPDSAGHPSVGSEADVLAREEMRKKVAALRLSAAQLEPYVLSLDAMRTWGYVVEVPPGPGGERPHEEGAVMTCERCAQKFQVKRREEADECRFHWGRPFSSKVNGRLAEATCWLAAVLNAHFRREETRLYVLFAHTGRGGVSDRPACVLRVQC